MQTPIIPLSDTGLQSSDWQWHIRNAVRDPVELARLLDIEVQQIDTDFPLLVPRPFIERMRRGDPNDPLLKQVLPVHDETLDRPGYTKDPLNELKFTGTRGLVQKYSGRALVIATGTCAVNCRYCFRRHFPYADHQAGKTAWAGIIDHVEKDTTIKEVILSGGDPLVLNDPQLEALTRAIDAIPHVSTIRFHTRVPVVIPQRINDELLAWLSRLSSKVVFVLHINHANEINDQLTRVLKPLSDQGVTLLNQAVLLRGVNDSAKALADLSTHLFEAGVLPYYLHLLDPVSGAGHFDVVEDSGRKLIGEVSALLPGYLVPRLVREEPGETSKTAIAIR